MSPRVLLATTVQWPSFARLAGAFAGVGAQVEALLPSGHVAGKSRFVSRTHAYNPLFPLGALARAIAAAAPDLVVPGDDRALAHLLSLSAGHAALVERSLGRVASYATLIARRDFIGAAQAAGIAAPRTIRLDGAGDLEAGLAAIGFPAVLKVDGSWGGEGTVVAANPEQARAAYARLAATPSRGRSVLRAILRRDANFLHEALSPPARTVNLQAFIPGKPATSAFACWKGRVLASIHMDVLETLYPCGPATVMRRVDCPQMEQAAVRLAEQFGLSGLHGLDFVRDGTGQAHLIEINPRATQASAFALGPGHDLAAALAGCLAPAARWPRPLLTENPVLALFPQEWRRDPQSAWLHSAYPDVPWDDPEVLRACLAPGQKPPERRSPERSPALTLRQALGR
ncbi:MAG: ATP-grasp domain-containing protein [Rhizomicrobium sp.]